MAAVMCLLDRRSNRLPHRLRAAGHHVYETFTGDHAVALCVNHYVDVAVLDQAVFVETDCWSVARSIKLVRPSVKVVLMTRGIMIADQKPLAVDAVLGHGSVLELLNYLDSQGISSDRGARDQLPRSDTIQ